MIDFAIFKSGPRRSIGDIVAQVTVREVMIDDLMVTDHPVERGANISDHAYKNPSQLVIEAGWSNSVGGLAGTVAGLAGAAGGALGNAIGGPVGAAIGGALAGGGALSAFSGGDPNRAREIYQQLLALQATREPFKIVTGKRVYQNMLITSIAVTEDESTANALFVTLACREVIIVETAATAVPDATVQADPAATAAPLNTGTKQVQPAPAANQSALAQTAAQ